MNSTTRCTPGIWRIGRPGKAILVLAGLTLSLGFARAGKAPAGPWEVIGRSQYKDDYRYTAFLDDSYGLAAVGCCKGQIRRTVDLGKTWRDLDTPITSTGLDLAGAKTAWAGGDSELARSLDGGQSWEEVPYPARGNFEYLSFLDAENGWAASPYKLFATADGGKTWASIKLPKQGLEIAALALRAPGQGYVLDSGGAVYSTIDEGKSWSVHNLGLQGERLFIVGSPVAAMRFVDADRGVAVACRPSAPDRTVAFLTKDGGRTWREEPVLQGPKLPRLYLASDGFTLTMTEGPRIIVLRRKPDSR